MNSLRKLAIIIVVLLSVLIIEGLGNACNYDGTASASCHSWIVP